MRRVSLIKLTLLATDQLSPMIFRLILLFPAVALSLNPSDLGDTDCLCVKNKNGTRLYFQNQIVSGELSGAPSDEGLDVLEYDSCFSYGMTSYSYELVQIFSADTKSKTGFVRLEDVTEGDSSKCDYLLDTFGDEEEAFEEDKRQSDDADRPSYAVAFPNFLRPGVDFTIVVSIFTEFQEDVTITASIVRTGGQTVVTAIDSIDSAGTKRTRNIVLKPPNDLRLDMSYMVKVTAQGGLDFARESTVAIAKDNLYVLIQTDKGRYSGGQEVRYRVVVLYPDLTLYGGNIDLEILDGSDNKIQKLLDWPLHNGVYVNKFTLSDEPVFGTWKIKVTAKERTKTVTFGVGTYVLPRFNVTVDKPDAITPNMTEIVVKVHAQYTFLEPVVGKAKLEFFQSSKIYPVEELINGTVEFRVNVSKLKSEFGTVIQELNIRASVRDEATHMILATDRKIFFTGGPKISITLTDKLRIFRPATQYFTHIQIEKFYDNVTSHVTGTVQVQVVDRIPVIELCNSTNEEYISEFTNRIIFDRPNLVLSTDGKASLTFNIPSSSVEIKMQIAYEGTVEIITLRSAESSPTTLIKAFPDKIPVQVGDTLTITVKSKKKLTGKINYQITSKGILVESDDYNVRNSKQRRFNFEVKPTMAPQSRMLIYYSGDDGTLLTDVLTLFVTGSPSRYEVKVQFSSASLSAGVQEKIEIYSKPDSTVYLATLDERVKILQEGNDINKEQVSRHLSQTVSSMEDEDASLKIHSTRRKRSSYNYKRYQLLKSLKQLLQLRNFDLFGEGGNTYVEAGEIFMTDGKVFNQSQISVNSAAVSRIPTTCEGVSNQPNGQDLPDLTEQQGSSTEEETPPVNEQNDLHGEVVEEEEDNEYGGYEDFGGGDEDFGEGEEDFDGENEDFGGNGGGGSSSPDTSRELEETLGLFTEAWLWEEVKIGNDGKATIEKTVPDTITSWITSAFSVNSRFGFGVTDTMEKVTVKRKLFAVMDLPEYIILNEVFYLQITVFNYFDKQIPISMLIERSDNENALSRGLEVPAGEGRSMYIRYTPERVGDLLIRVSVWDETGSIDDNFQLTKKLLVKPFGVYQEDYIHTLMELRDVKTWAVRTILLDHPNSVVDSSMTAQVTVSGDIMAASIATIEDLHSFIRLPSGCAEQVMSSMAPNVYITNYLQATGKLTDEIRNKALENMEVGLQKIYGHQHHDGSYNYLKESNKNIWLTAYVARCLHEAKSFERLFVDNEKIANALRFLITQQNSNGVFGVGGTGSNGDWYFGVDELTSEKLTSFVTIVFLECRDDSSLGVNVTLETQKAIDGLESRLPDVDNVYTLAMMCYAFTMAESEQKDACFLRLKDTAMATRETIHWQTHVTPAVRRNMPRKSENEVSVDDIIVTSYALLTYVNRNEILDAHKIAMWLVEQSNGAGGFKSSRDTVVALQALSEYATKWAKIQAAEGVITKDLTVGMNAYYNTSPRKKRYPLYVLSEADKEVLRTRKVGRPEQLTKINIGAKGTGLVLVNVILSYYIAPSVNDTYIKVNVTDIEETTMSVTKKICASWLDSVPSGMVVMEVGLPTGFDANRTVLQQQKDIQRVETKRGNAVLYFYQLTTSGICVNVTSDRADPVIKSQSTHVTVYAYYNPAKIGMHAIEYGPVNSANICDICPHCNFCNAIATITAFRRQNLTGNPAETGATLVFDPFPQNRNWSVHAVIKLEVEASTKNRP